MRPPISHIQFYFNLVGILLHSIDNLITIVAASMVAKLVYFRFQYIRKMVFPKAYFNFFFSFSCIGLSN